LKLRYSRQKHEANKEKEELSPKKSENDLYLEVETTHQGTVLSLFFAEALPCSSQFAE